MTKDVGINAKIDTLKIASAGSTVTVHKSGARSVNLGQVVNSDGGREQLRQIQEIQDRQTNRGQESGMPSPDFDDLPYDERLAQEVERRYRSMANGTLRYKPIRPERLALIFASIAEDLIDRADASG